MATAHDSDSDLDYDHLASTSDEEYTPETAPEVSRPTPRTKISRKSNHGTGAVRRKGKLSKFMQLPVELLCEIASHLHPKSLFKLVRVSKITHQLLMSSPARAVWQMVADRVELPVVQSPIHLIKIMKLCFCETCTLCGREWRGVSEPRFQMVWLDKVCPACQEKR
ncbi:BQ2448_7860 [Microbotryum intermedium]|uniref:BQ2448_38 protein n=1 Tax=Microbotryum intermedium TaxID=269621 RepID=A0A238FLH8_9BASI|nr:BQ2448_3840 [Microbotryum intermedium]SCV72873.1 BQ2448_4410 [Microbotryum intermedium]SCV72877.1 BQ2448_38 [Microbotryum intermedium]SCV74489.1 BQ2448_8130 [Microbotryum intermedium]SCV74831.1 BQ2448_7860 [Microbotryum intermedium]